MDAATTSNLRLLLSTFSLVFVAELGDKTQLAVLTLSAGSTSRWTIFAGSALALAATSALGVLGGDVVARFVSPVWIKRIAGIAFVVLGLWYVATAAKSD
jgi:putative Ca2+/H+ antiporter (TMEM165/GDT1 family)